MSLSLSRGTSLGNYEISLLLGKGGMGEVWRASDTRLGRDVAIKTLPPEFSSDVDRLTRFEREAKVLASLNHPHIAAIWAPGGRELLYRLNVTAGTTPKLNAVAITPNPCPHSQARRRCRFRGSCRW